MKLLLSWLILFILASFFFVFKTPVFADIIINEVLPNPVGDDNASKPNGEWVELFNNSESVDASGWILYDSDDKHELVITLEDTNGGTIIPAHGWLVIYRNGDSDFSLNNSGDETVRLFNKTIESGLIPISTFSYSGSTEEKSWGRIPDGEEQIQKLDPSMGSANLQVSTPTVAPIVTSTSTLTPKPTATPKPTSQSTSTKSNPSPSPSKAATTPVVTSISPSISKTGEVLGGSENKEGTQTSQVSEATLSPTLEPTEMSTSSMVAGWQQNLPKISLIFGGLLLLGSSGLILLKKNKDKFRAEDS